MKKTCPNGHVYDQSIYGDSCPLCPSSSNTKASNPTKVAPGAGNGPHTRVVQPAGPVPSGAPIGMPNFPSAATDPVGSTKVAPSLQQQVQNAAQKVNQGSKTRIRSTKGRPGAPATPDEDRKLVGFLVTYNRTPMGKAFNIYEGRNYVGRSADCDIAIPDDEQMSGKHLLIRYLSGNNKFSFRDEMSSNGTYVNKELMDEGELQNYDIIRVGGTLFIFIAIPQI